MQRLEALNPEPLQARSPKLPDCHEINKQIHEYIYMNRYSKHIHTYIYIYVHVYLCLCVYTYIYIY